MQGSGNLSQFEDMQMSNPTTSNLSNVMIDESLKINPGLVLMVVMMMVVGLMAMRNKRKQQQPESKLEWDWYVWGWNKIADFFYTCESLSTFFNEGGKLIFFISFKVKVILVT